MYTVTRPETLIYVTRNVKKYKICLIENENDNENENENENIRADEIDGECMQMKNKNENNDIEMNNKNNNENDEMNNKMMKVFLDHSDEKKLVKTVCYENINLLLLSNSAETHDLLTLKIDLQYMKKHQRQSKK